MKLQLKNINFKKIILPTIIYALFFVEFFLFNNIYGKDFLVIMSFFLIGLISLTAIYLSPHVISSFKMVNFFIFFFFYYFALKQYCNGTVIWEFMHQYNFLNADFIYTNLIVLLFMAILYSIYYLLIIKTNRSQKYRVDMTTPFSRFCEGEIMLSKSKTFILTAISIILFLIFGVVFGFGSLFGVADAKIVFNSTIELILTRFVRLIPFAIVLILLNSNKNGVSKKWYALCLIINIISSFCLCFPFGGMARYCVALVGIAILLKFVLKYIKSKSFIAITMLIAIMVIFPTINFFRNNSLSDLSNFGVVFSNYSSGDFDAYQMLMTTIKFVQINGVGHFSNIITAILFFIPRCIWSSKMIGTGHYVATMSGSDFTNLSCPFIAEGYFALGLAGVLLMTLILAVVLVLTDNNLLTHSTFKNSIAYIVVGLMFFIMRGDLLSTYSALVGAILAVVFIYIILHIISRIRFRREVKHVRQ